MGWETASHAARERWPPLRALAAAMYRITLIVNDEKFLICSKLCRIELFEAEFNIKLFVLAEFDSLDQADQ